ncbi:MAG: C-GCAxxG-C-C family protein [Tissierellia bacterium]|nr:C-GCAxxG-C-C family protein [Tissierellia bacterium]
MSPTKQKRYNCNQKVLSHFCESKDLIHAGALFGSGMRLASVCGAYTGALMVLGVKLSEDGDVNSAYKIFDEEFTSRVGCRNCFDILGKDATKPDERQALIEEGIIPNRCNHAIETAIDIIENILAK